MKLQLLLGIVVAVCSIASSQNYVPLPIVLWHGMGDSCCFPFSLGSFKGFLEKQLPGVYVKSLRIGGSLMRDYESGFFIHPDIQIEDACNQIRNDPKLGRGFNAIGFSQGGQFLRAVKQRCNKLPMKNLISMGGQHQGVFGLPNCPNLREKTCEYFRRLLNIGAYTPFLQKRLVQATYWHDPLHEEAYVKGSSFLADINNERSINMDYVTGLQSLNKFVMVKFINDTIVVPRESQWFEFYAPGQDTDIVSLRNSRLYTNDTLGLKAMDRRNQLMFLTSPGNHLQFTHEWFNGNVLPYLK